MDARTFAYLPIHEDRQNAWSNACEQLASLGFNNLSLAHSVPLADLNFPADEQIFGHIISPEFHAFTREGEQRGVDYSGAFRAHELGSRGQAHIVRAKNELRRHADAMQNDGVRRSA